MTCSFAEGQVVKRRYAGVLYCLVDVVVELAVARRNDQLFAGDDLSQAGSVDLSRRRYGDAEEDDAGVFQSVSLRRDLRAARQPVGDDAGDQSRSGVDDAGGERLRPQHLQGGGQVRPAADDRQRLDAALEGDDVAVGGERDRDVGRVSVADDGDPDARLTHVELSLDAVDEVLHVLPVVGDRLGRRVQHKRQLDVAPTASLGISCWDKR